MDEMKRLQEALASAKQVTLSTIERSERFTLLLVLGSVVVAIVLLTRVLRTLSQQLGADPAPIRRRYAKWRKRWPLATSARPSRPPSQAV